MTLLAPSNGTPWYKNSCITSALESYAVNAGVDSIGFIPEAGGVARVIGHQAGYVGVVADKFGSKLITAAGKTAGVENSSDVAAMLQNAFGLPTPECEFGACGAGPFGLSPGSIGANFSQIAIDPQVLYWMHPWYWALSGSHKPVHGLYHYGNWCGPGGSGIPTNFTDAGCMLHDFCYYQGGFTWGSNFQGFNAQLQACNQQLCNTVRARENSLNPQIVNQGPFSPLAPEANNDSEIYSYFGGIIAPWGNECR